MNENSGHILKIKDAYGQYLNRWYQNLFADTTAMQEFVRRGFARCAMWAPGRMIDAAEDMLASYRKNENGGTAGQNSLLPVIIVAMSKDMNPVNGDVGLQVGDRIMVRLTDDVDASVYGYRQGFYEIRTQIAVFAADEPTARSIAAQLLVYLGARGNRRFDTEFQWGEYTLQHAVTIETPDVPFMEVKTDQKNLTVLAGDVTLRATIPYFDAPAEGQPNDGTSRNPPGYPVLAQVNFSDLNDRTSGEVTAAGTVFGDVPPGTGL